MTNDVNAFLMGGGARSAKFAEINDRVWGSIMSSETRQQTDFKTGALLYWNDGKPRMQVVITLMTDEHEDDDDDSLRAVYVKGELQKAFRAALVKAGVNGIEDGGKLLVQFTSEAPPKVKGENGAKLYYVKYEPPAHITELPVQPDDEGPAEPF